MMKKPMFAATSMQMQADAGMNPFALQLIAEAHADNPERFKDQTIIAVARAHNGTPVYILISTQKPEAEQFAGWPIPSDGSVGHG